MRRTLPLLCLAALSALAACAEIATGPDPRDGFSERNIGQTVVTHVERMGTQAVYMAPSGDLYVWSGANPEVQRGSWRYDILATGQATTYVGAGGINHPVEELETQWGICFQYRDAAGNILRRREGGDWNCALLTDYEALIVDRAAGDTLGLSRGGARPAMPPGLLTAAQLARL